MPHVAVLGTGSIGTTHLRVLSTINGAVPIAVPLRAERRNQLSQEGYQIAVDLDDAVRLRAKLCIVATDTSRHVADGISALERGLDVLMEKPMALDAPSAQQLNKRAVDLGRKLFIGCVMRFSASLTSFREIRNRVGQPHSVHVECRSYLPDWRPSRPYLNSYSARPDEGGVMRDLIHEIDYAGWIFGWPDSTFATIMNTGRLGIESEDMVGITWQTAAGCSVSVDLDYLTRPTRRRMTAYGEWGILEWDGVAGTVALTVQDNQEEEFSSIQSRDQMFQEQTQAFIDACHGKADPRLATGEDGVRALAVCDSARRASSARREQTVEYPSRNL